MRFRILARIIVAATATSLPGFARQPAQPLSEMPVREVSVFKDGHAFVLHQGRLEVDDAGKATLDFLPAPVIGTFWPFAAESGAVLASVVASRRDVAREENALSMRELLEANVGSEVVITEIRGGGHVEYRASIRDVPNRVPEGGQPAEAGDVVLLTTESGTKALPLNRIYDVSFTGSFNPRRTRSTTRGMMTLSFEPEAGRLGGHVQTGLLYLQRGIRWIPSYRVNVDGEGRATVKLQATLVNELVDLEDVTAHLIVGVPRFAFENTVDPIGLQETVAQLSQAFRRDAQTAYGFANAIMTQQPMAMEEAGRSMDVPVGPEVTGAMENEDLFVFTVEHVTLAKGERMVLPIAEFALPYRDVYRLDIPFTPPMEIWRTMGSGRQADMANFFGSPRVMHKLRITNESGFPLTTAPALILRDDRILAQGMMRYTSIGAETDLAITEAVDINVKKADNEAGRTPNAVRWQGDEYGRVDLEGVMTLTNYSGERVEVEVVRHVLGNVDSVGSGGKIEMVNVFEDSSYAADAGPLPLWWTSYSWPWWWYHFNAIGRITWTLELDAGEEIALGYRWNYYWR